MNLKCPNDIKLVLPLGCNSMSLPLDFQVRDLNSSKTRSEPDGVLDGRHKIPVLEILTTGETNTQQWL